MSRQRSAAPLRHVLAWLGAACAFLPAAGSAAAPGYLTVTPIAGKYSRVTALNDAGRYAVNDAAPDINIEPAHISGEPLNEPVGSLGGYATKIWGLNIKGEAVGQSTTADGAWHAFLYSSGRMQDLTLKYGIGSVGAINDRGDITGVTADERAMVIRDGRVEVIGPPSSSAGAINEGGDVLVSRYGAESGFLPCVYSQGRCTDLPLFNGKGVNASAINDAGWTAGTGTTVDGRQHAWFYDGDTMLDLTPAATNAAAFAINNLGHVVGSMDNRAFLYADGKLIDLNTLVDPGADLLLTSAYAINNSEQIVANSCDRTGVFCYGTELLSAIPAVPEPPRAAMWLAALALLAARRVRHSVHDS